LPPPPRSTVDTVEVGSNAVVAELSGTEVAVDGMVEVVLVFEDDVDDGSVVDDARSGTSTMMAWHKGGTVLGSEAGVQASGVWAVADPIHAVRPPTTIAAKNRTPMTTCRVREGCRTSPSSRISR